MILYAVYKNHPKKMVEDPKLQLSEHRLGSMVCSEVNAVVPHPNNTNTRDHDASNNV